MLMSTVEVLSTFTLLEVLTVNSKPALTLVCIFMSYPPYELGTFLGLVTGLRPLGSKVTIGVVL